jgi:hypothetical protein
MLQNFEAAEILLSGAMFFLSFSSKNLHFIERTCNSLLVRLNSQDVNMNFSFSTIMILNFSDKISIFVPRKI